MAALNLQVLSSAQVEVEFEVSKMVKAKNFLINMLRVVK